MTRFEDHDRADIQRLAHVGLLDTSTFEERCREALDYCVGDTNFLLLNIADAVAMIRACSREWKNT